MHVIFDHLFAAVDPVAQIDADAEVVAASSAGKRKSQRIRVGRR